MDITEQLSFVIHLRRHKYCKSKGALNRLL